MSFFKKARFKHYRPNEDAQFGGGYTFAFHQEGNTVYYGMARCHPKDQFNKKKGCELALNNLTANSHMLQKNEKFIPDLFFHVLIDYYEAYSQFVGFVVKE